MLSFLHFIYALHSGGGINEEAVSSIETKEFDIESKNWAFSPDTITVNKGDKVTLNFETLDDGIGGGHGIAIPIFGVSESLRGGNSVTVEFIADKKGTFPFFCTVYCGSGHGNMKGRLIVK